MTISFLIILSCISIVLSNNDNLTRDGNYKCADVYCINLDTYSKLDVPTTPVKVSLRRKKLIVDTHHWNPLSKIFFKNPRGGGREEGGDT